MTDDERAAMIAVFLAEAKRCAMLAAGIEPLSDAMRAGLQAVRNDGETHH